MRIVVALACLAGIAAPLPGSAAVQCETPFRKAVLAAHAPEAFKKAFSDAAAILDEATSMDDLDAVARTAAGINDGIVRVDEKDAVAYTKCIAGEFLASSHDKLARAHVAKWLATR